MKLVKLRAGAALNSVDIFKAVLERGPVQMAEVRKRNRVLRVLENNTGDALLLEDADHTTLVAAMDAYVFGLSSVELEAIDDELRQAKEPPRAAPPADRPAE
jgi:hypothetical protein